MEKKQIVSALKHKFKINTKNPKKQLWQALLPYFYIMWLMAWQAATAAAQGQWTAQWRLVRGEAGCSRITIHRGKLGSGVSLLPVPWTRALLPLLRLPLHLSHSALGPKDEVWSGQLQCLLPKSQTHFSSWQNNNPCASFGDILT